MSLLLEREHGVYARARRAEHEHSIRNADALEIRYGPCALQITRIACRQQSRERIGSVDVSVKAWCRAAHGQSLVRTHPFASVAISVSTATKITAPR